MSDRTVLAARSVSKRFGAVTALDDVSFDLRAGEIHALCGENGAGKSTLIKLLSGVHPYGSYDGDIVVDDRAVDFRSTRDAERAGIAIIHQELALFPDMTVGENLFLGVFPQRFGRIDWDRVYAQSSATLAGCGIQLDPATRVGDLGIGQQQLVEIARAIARNPKVLVLDEPTAALSRNEIDSLLAQLRRLRERGVACVFISHKLDEVFAIADRITVLRDGSVQGTLEAASTYADEIIRRMVGRRIADHYPRRLSTPGRALLSLHGVDVDPPSPGGVALRGIAFEARAGEVLGIGGLMGAGRTELLLHLMGLWGQCQAGTIELDGQAFVPSHPRAALAQGLAIVTEDRKRYGLVLPQGVTFNVSLSSLRSLRRGAFIDRDSEVARTRTIVDDLHIKAQSLEQAVGTLSGGNQQKVVLGRMLLTQPKVLLLDEPTRGIDVGAKLEVYELINRLTTAGQAIVLVSSELGELLGMSDRIVMLCEGRVGGTFERSAATPERLLAAAMGRQECAA